MEKVARWSLPCPCTLRLRNALEKWFLPDCCKELLYVFWQSRTQKARKYPHFLENLCSFSLTQQYQESTVVLLGAHISGKQQQTLLHPCSSRNMTENGTLKLDPLFKQSLSLCSQNCKLLRDYLISFISRGRIARKLLMLIKSFPSIPTYHAGKGENKKNHSLKNKFFSIFLPKKNVTTGKWLNIIDFFIYFIF